MTQTWPSKSRIDEYSRVLRTHILFSRSEFRAHVTWCHEGVMLTPFPVREFAAFVQRYTIAGQPSNFMEYKSYYGGDEGVELIFAMDMLNRSKTLEAEATAMRTYFSNRRHQQLPRHAVDNDTQALLSPGSTDTLLGGVTSTFPLVVGDARAASFDAAKERRKAMRLARERGRNNGTIPPAKPRKKKATTVIKHVTWKDMLED